MLSFLTVFSLFPHVDLEAREKHRAELMNDVEWKETCMTVIITSIIVVGLYNYYVVDFSSIPLSMYGVQ